MVRRPRVWVGSRCRHSLRGLRGGSQHSSRDCGVIMTRAQERPVMCQDPAHEPPVNLLKPGTYFYQCPACKTGGHFTVEAKTVLKGPKQ